MAGLRPGHPRLACFMTVKTWMPGTRPGMTNCWDLGSAVHHRCALSVLAVTLDQRDHLRRVALVFLDQGAICVVACGQRRSCADRSLQRRNFERALPGRRAKPEYSYKHDQAGKAFH